MVPLISGPGVNPDQCNGSQDSAFSATVNNLGPVGRTRSHVDLRQLQRAKQGLPFQTGVWPLQSRSLATVLPQVNNTITELE